MLSLQFHFLNGSGGGSSGPERGSAVVAVAAADAFVSPVAADAVAVADVVASRAACPVAEAFVAADAAVAADATVDGIAVEVVDGGTFQSDQCCWGCC